MSEPNDKCPTCDSPAPHLHPAVQFEGEVQECADAFHQIRTNQNPPYQHPTPAPLSVPTLTRYDESQAPGGGYCIVPYPDGRFVLWAEVDALLRAREQDNRALKAAMECYERQWQDIQASVRAREQELADERHKVKVLEQAGQDIVAIHRAREQGLREIVDRLRVNVENLEKYEPEDIMGLQCELGQLLTGPEA